MASENSTSSRPFVFEPSGIWDGIDGNWSSFILQVGSPEPQEFRVFPSTVGQEVIVPLPEVCTTEDPANCSTTRGVLDFKGQNIGFLVNDSKTWEAAGLFTSTLEQTLGYEVAALYGYDTVILGDTDQSPVSVDRQVIGGVAAKDFYLGLFGLGIGTIEFGGGVTSNSTYLESLRHGLKIPSLSYGYTAGASYRNSLGSLTLGGYDASRFTPSKTTFPMNESAIIAPLQSILGQDTLNGTRALLSTAINVTIDTTLPYLWLPQDACDSFATALGLIYDNTTELYVADPILREQLLQAPPSFTFVFGNATGLTMNIAVPYSAFDLQATYPLYEGPTHYFPIRRAANDSQYTIGRALLQEAYLIVDYERQNFTIAQAKSIDNGTMPDIITIEPPRRKTSVLPAKGKSVGGGAIAGIVIGVVIILSCIVVFLFLRQRKSRQQRRSSPDDPQSRITDYKDEKRFGQEKAEADGTQIHEMAGQAARLAEFEGDTGKWGSHGAQELPTPPIGQHAELAADYGAHEMDENRPVYELPGDRPAR